MAGTPKYLYASGYKFKIPADAEPKVVKGGRYFSENEAYGDGSAEPIEKVVIGGITDMQVFLGDGAYAAFEKLTKQKNITFVYESATKTYELTGNIVLSDGSQINSAKDKSETFEIRCSIGTVKES